MSAFDRFDDRSWCTVHGVADRCYLTLFRRGTPILDALLVRTRAYGRAAIECGIIRQADVDNRTDGDARLALMRAWLWAFPGREIKLAVTREEEDAFVVELVRAFKGWEAAGLATRLHSRTVSP